jgi:hypothetical protein
MSSTPAVPSPPTPPLEQDDLQKSRSFSAYAPPLSWGPWQTIYSTSASITLTVSYEAIGDTVVYGAISYYSQQGARTENFVGSTTITTGSAYANVSVCFYGSPLGSGVMGSIDP